MQQCSPHGAPVGGTSAQGGAPSRERKSGEGRPKGNKEGCDNVETARGDERRQAEGVRQGKSQSDREGHGEGGGRRLSVGGVNFRNWQSVYEELETICPDYKTITVSNGSANVAYDRMGNQRASDKYTFIPETGEITKVDYYVDQPKSGKIRGWIYSVHVGSFGGSITRILWFLGALMGAVLPATGYYLWIRRLVKKRNRKAKDIQAVR